MKEHLMKTKTALSTALQRFCTMELSLYITTNTPVARPTSNAIVLESSLRWSDKLLVMATMSTAGDQVCPVVLKMSEFDIKRRDKVEWYSEFFYTHNKGYKMCLRVDAAGNGDGEGTQLSVYLYLMKGPHNDELTWPMRGEYEIKLLNQISNSEHHSKMVSYDNCTSTVDIIDRVRVGDKASFGWGEPQFISNKCKTTPTCQYLKDNCLFLQMIKL